jgi:predicted ATP-dependent endonuclease of OLD family
LIKTKEYTETVFCIDEPELHIHTAIQRKLLIEIEKLIPAECQLWIATHSLGFLRAIQDELNDQSQVLDFSASDYFTGVHVIYPIKMTRTNWKRIFSTALDDLIGLVSPKKIIYCEGKAEPSRNGEEAGLDAIVLNNIFSENYSDTVFVSSGGNTELDQRSEVAIIVLRKVLTDTEILVLKDRDISSGKITSEAQRQLYLKNNPDSHRVLKRWELENYLFDKEVLIKYTRENSLTFDEQSYDAKVKDIENQSIKDDIGFIKNMCGITTSISPKLFKTSLSKTITKDMRIYSELEQAIFLRV